MLDLRQLRYFVAVAETQNVGRAAERLGISQSPLSRQVKQLEARLGVNLFHREKQRVRLTNEGKAFLSEARELLSHAHAIEQRAKRTGGAHKGTVVIGAVAGAVTSQLLPAHVRDFHKHYADITVELRIMRSAAQFEALKEQDIDVGYTYSTAANPDVVTHLLSDEALVLASPREHPVNRSRKAVRPEFLDGQPFISMPANSSPAWHRRFVEACGRAGFTPEIKYEVTDLSTALGLVSAGLGLALVQKSAANASLPGVVFRDVPWSLPRIQIYLALRRNRFSATSAAYANCVLGDGLSSLVS